MSVHPLQAIPLFSQLEEASLAQIEKLAIYKIFAKQDTIFLEEQPGEGLHYVVRGRVKIVKLNEEGREHIIHILGAGELFAEVLLFNHAPYPATAIALEETEVGLLRNSDLEKLILQDNRLALSLIQALSQRLLYAQQKIKNLALQDVTGRTAETLLRLGREHGKSLPNGRVEIDLDLSRQDLGNLVGTTRETVTRTLMSLKKEGLIDFDGQKLLLLKPNELAWLIA